MPHRKSRFMDAGSSQSSEEDPAAPVTLADYFVIVGIDEESYGRLTQVRGNAFRSAVAVTYGPAEPADGCKSSSSTNPASSHAWSCSPCLPGRSRAEDAVSTPRAGPVARHPEHSLTRISRLHTCMPADASWHGRYPKKDLKAGLPLPGGVEKFWCAEEKNASASLVRCGSS